MPECQRPRPCTSTRESGGRGTFAVRASLGRPSFHGSPVHPFPPCAGLPSTVHQGGPTSCLSAPLEKQKESESWRISRRGKEAEGKGTGEGEEMYVVRKYPRVKSKAGRAMNKPQTIGHRPTSPSRFRMVASADVSPFSLLQRLLGIRMHTRYAADASTQPID
ncbi:hypothetical protein LZ30DRAFT_731518 [Colletotrichum cereale]|nr:hypothetical protein LZ30DRAFT_731518 [Colletotrichum cereale]